MKPRKVDLRVLTTLLLSMLCLTTFAQMREITGTVTDGTGEPIIGANILEVGTTNGVITDFDGNFKLSVQSDAQIQISYIGFISQTVSVKNRTEIKIVLK